MRVDIYTARSTLVKIILARSKLSKTEATILASDYLEGELQGKTSHGLAAFPAMLEKLPQASSSYKKLKETESFIYADGQGGIGSIIGRKLADKAMTKARHQGVATVLIKEIKTWLRPAAIAQYIADNNMVGLVINTGGVPMVAPPGGRDPVIGTNPIGIGIPAADNPVVIDMATSARAWGEVRLAKEFGHPLPENSFIDKEGLPTVDVNTVHAALPMGGYKGFGLGLLIEVLAGNLAGMDANKDGVNSSYRSVNRGAMILVIDPEITVGTSKFKKANQELMDSIRQSSPAKGSPSVTLPGDRAQKAKHQNEQNSYLEINDQLWTQITSLL